MYAGWYIWKYVLVLCILLFVCLFVVISSDRAAVRVVICIIEGPYVNVYK